MENKFDFSNDRLPFEWQELNYLELEVEIGIDSFKSLIYHQENLLTSIKKKFRDVITNDKEYNLLEEPEKSSYYGAFHEREEVTIKELQRQLRYSICLSLFSFFEGRLDYLCKQIEKQFTFEIKIKDLYRGNDLMKYWNYLEKVFEIETVEVKPVFDPINQQKIIRNKIAHLNGLVSEGQIADIPIVDGLKLIRSGVDFQIEIIDISYFDNLLKNIEKFYKELLLAIDKELKVKTFIAPKEEGKNTIVF